jgi:hypothetical protein
MQLYVLNMRSVQLLFQYYYFIHTYIHIYIHTYHSRFIPEGAAEAYQIFLRDAHVLPQLFSYE